MISCKIKISLWTRSLNRERAQQQSFLLKPPYNNTQEQRGNPGWKPRAPNEQRVPNTLALANVINQEGGPWCLPCGDSHWEYECPRLHHNNGSDEDPNSCEHMNYINTLDPIYTIYSYLLDPCMPWNCYVLVL
jgi:hypothetical protein